MDVTAPGRELATGFQSLGIMTDKTSEDIIAIVSLPTSRSSMAHGQTLLQWQATGYHIALLFNAEGRFVNITHEFSNYSAPPQSFSGWEITLMIVISIIAIIAAIAFRADFR
jgi:hypothetical protein